MHRWFKRLRNVIRLRTRRQYFIARAIVRGRRLRCLRDRTASIACRDVLTFVTLRNERVRLPYFLEYYRSIGVSHFLIVDNGSDDGSAEYLLSQPDVSLWSATESYKSSRFGMDWINYLLRRYGSGHWCLTVDPDEFLVYPHANTRPLTALADWMEGAGRRSFSAMLLDMYPKGAVVDQSYREGQNPFEIANWFDPSNYSLRKNPLYLNLWIQGGPRARLLFAENPDAAPALNKIPLVFWKRRYVYASSTHMLLPRSLNVVYDEGGGEMASGVLLHAKFLPSFIEKSAEELQRRQHYANSQEYRAYNDGVQEAVDFWCPQSQRYRDWRQLEELGLISRGNWA